VKPRAPAANGPKSVWSWCRGSLRSGGRGELLARRLPGRRRGLVEDPAGRVFWRPGPEAPISHEADPGQLPAAFKPGNEKVLESPWDRYIRHR
jgi:hypothetical protein